MGPWASQSGHGAARLSPRLSPASPSLEAECKAGARNAEVAASAPGTCLSRARRTKSRGPLRPQALAPEAGGKTAKGKCPEDRGPEHSEPLGKQREPEGGGGAVGGEGWLEPASEELTVHWPGKEDWIGVRALTRVVGASPPCTCCRAPPRQGVPGTPGGWGGGAFQPPPRLRREGRTPGHGREDELGATTFSGPKAGRLGFHAYAVPGESTPPETLRKPQAVGGGGQGQTRREGLTWTRPCGKTFGEAEIGRGERTAGTPHLASRVLRPEPGPTPRAQSLACVPIPQHRARRGDRGVGSGVPR